MSGHPGVKLMIAFFRPVAAAAVAASMLASCGAALALDQIRLGKAVPNSFAFGAADVGVEAKIYEQEGIELQITSFAGDARLQQAMAADSIDVAVGSGPGSRVRAKGVPGDRGGRHVWPAEQSLPDGVVELLDQDHCGPQGQAHRRHHAGIADRLVSTRELSQQQGWGHDGIEVLALGGVPPRLAAMERNELDGLVIESATAFELEEQGKGRNILLFGDIEKRFYTHVIYATDTMIGKRPELLQRFLRAWFKTIAFMKANKAFTVATEAKTIQVRESVAAKVYDTEMSSFSTDGAWDPVSIDVIRNSLKDLGILNFVPEAKTIYNDKFVPVKF